MSEERTWSNVLGDSASELTLEGIEKLLAEWKARMDRPRFPFITPKIELPQPSWPIFFSNIGSFYQPANQAIMLLLAIDIGPSIVLRCVTCQENLEPGRIAYFCSEECEKAFRQRYPDLGLPELRTDQELPELE
mgnify:CR=1 FL=1